MSAKQRVALIFGGRSAEHEVSLRSARSIYRALSPDRYQQVLIGIDKHGHWRLQNEAQLMDDTGSGKLECVSAHGEEVGMMCGGELRSLESGRTLGYVDVAFPVLHGPNGEDGTVQGLLKLSKVPFVGCDVLASALCMDKDLTKRVLRDAGIRVAPFIAVTERSLSFPEAARELKPPFFVKPANLGSSVGISRVGSQEEFEKALALAFSYDRKVLVEQEVKGREVECSVLGNQTPMASIAGEIVPASKHGFYSYDAKYLDDAGAQLMIPADIGADAQQLVQKTAIAAYRALGCEGMARVDFFVVRESGAPQAIVNEVNTIPGFTDISMYPKLWEASGLPFVKLVDRLIELALERSTSESALRSSFV